jgi:parvulin-like peptidyl-prolyl isomerase
MRRVCLEVCATAVVVVLMLSPGSCSRQRFVADVAGIRKISADEFVERYTKYRELGSPRDNILLREKILNNMINELLILEDCRKKGYDSDNLYRERMEEISLQALLDVYAKHISIDSVTVSEQELRKEFLAYNGKVKVRYVYGKTEEEARGLRQRLERGESFESIAKETFVDPDLAKNGGLIGFIGYGDTDPAFEAAAFSLAPGALSDPVKFGFGYAIIKVEQRVQTPLVSEIDFAKQKPKLEEAIRERKMRQLIAATTDRISRDLDPKFNDSAVEEVSRLWSELFREGTDASSMERAKQLAPDVAAMPMVQFRGQRWTVGDFVQMATRTSDKQRRSVKTEDDVKDVAVGLAVRQVLLARAKESGLERDLRVRDQVSRVREDFLLRRWATAVQDTAGQSGWNDDGLRKVFSENKEQFAVPMLVDVAEIITRSPANAKAALMQVRKGVEFADVARKMSVRSWSARQGGELGYGSLQQYGIMGKKFFEAKVGEVIGPEALPPYFGVFKILGKKAGRERTFEEARDDVIRQVLPGRKKEAFAGAVDVLRAHARVSIDMQELGNVVIPSN